MINIYPSSIISPNSLVFKHCYKFNFSHYDKSDDYLIFVLLNASMDRSMR